MIADTEEALSEQQNSDRNSINQIVCKSENISPAEGEMRR
jgi:hypothetical protein